MNKQGEYIATFDDEGLVANAAVIKNKATIVNLSYLYLIQILFLLN